MSAIFKAIENVPEIAPPIRPSNASTSVKLMGITSRTNAGSKKKLRPAIPGQPPAVCDSAKENIP